MKDFLTLPWQDAEAYLVNCRQNLNLATSKAAQITERHIVTIFVLEGGASHKKDHPYCLPSHYTFFADTCRRYLKTCNGEVLPSSLDGQVDYLAVSWFADEVDAVTSAAMIHQHFLRETSKTALHGSMKSMFLVRSALASTPRFGCCRCPARTIQWSIRKSGNVYLKISSVLPVC